MESSKISPKTKGTKLEKQGQFGIHESKNVSHLKCPDQVRYYNALF